MNDGQSRAERHLEESKSSLLDDATILRFFSFQFQKEGVAIVDSEL